MHLQHYTPISTLVLCKYAETINLYCTKLPCLYRLMLHYLERVLLIKTLFKHSTHSFQDFLDSETLHLGIFLQQNCSVDCRKPLISRQHFDSARQLSL